MKLLSITISSLVLLSMAGCASMQHAAAKAKNSSPQEATADQSARTSTNSEARTSLVNNRTPSMPRDVVKSGSMTVQVDNVDNAERQAREVAEALGGRVDKVSSSDLASPQASMDMSLRIPVENFESAMERLQRIGTRLAKSVQVEDVTDQIIDFKARLRTMRIQEEFVREMLRKSSNLSDSLTINNDLSRLRAEIESLEAKRQALAGRAAYSTLELRLVQKLTAEAMAATDPNWFQTSWAAAWGAGTSVFRNLVGWIMWLVVFSPIWLVGVIAIRKSYRYVRTVESSSQAPQA